jgi:uncharacterized membrane protein HdeD (DUF308 family)
VGLIALNQQQTYHRVNVLLGVIGVAVGVLMLRHLLVSHVLVDLDQRRLANAIDLLVGLGTVMVTPEMQVYYLQTLETTYF